MTSTRAVGLLAVAVVVGLAVAPAASSAFASPVDGDGDSGGGEPNATVTTFMQSTAADAEHSVESGLFEATYENAATEQRADIVADRVDDLEARLATLEAEREQLRSADNRPGAYQARMTKLAVEISALERSIERTEPRAVEAGVDDERLATLRANTSALVDADVAATARGIPGLERQPGGPPADRGPNPTAPGAGAGGPPEQAAGNQTPPGQAGNQTPGNQGAPDQAGDGAAPGVDKAPSNNGNSENGNSNDERNGTGTGPSSQDGPDHERDRSTAGSETGNSGDESSDSSNPSDGGSEAETPSDGNDGTDGNSANSGTGENGGNNGNSGSGANSGTDKNDDNRNTNGTQGNQ